MDAGTRLRAIHHDGVLELLDPLELPEGTRVDVVVLPTDSETVEFAYPTRLVPAERLDRLTDLVAVGGNALADSEALYD
jgi:predicted DNA-binding antitoxin AbrB/MazE fold protein